MANFKDRLAHANLFGNFSYRVNGGSRYGVFIYYFLNQNLLIRIRRLVFKYDSELPILQSQHISVTNSEVACLFHDQIHACCTVLKS